MSLKALANKALAQCAPRTIDRTLRTFEPQNAPHITPSDAENVRTLIGLNQGFAVNDGADNLDLQNVAALDRAIKALATLARWLPDELVTVQARRKRMALDFVADELSRLNEALEHLRAGRECVVPAAQICQPFGQSKKTEWVTP
jgi:hypothetical protein